MRSEDVGRARVLAVVAVLLSGAVACVGADPPPESPGAAGETTEAEVARRAAAGPLNVLLITVDDMGWDSLGVTGSPIPNITPNIDRLAAEGVLFTQAHVTIAICQPTRAVWMTGRYPHRSGALGFGPIDPEVPTLVEALGEAGYQTGLMAKTGHVVPSRLSAFDAVIGAKELKNGRSPDLYYEHAAEFFRQAKNAGQPFFLMANSQDPHRPFAASQQEVNFRARDATSTSEQYGGGFPDIELEFAPEQIPVPGYLIDLPAVRLEVAQYYTSVQRADATVGAVLGALDDSGMADRTLVMFLSDHGPSLPFAKANVWMHSTRTPWIVRWPGVVAASTTDAGTWFPGSIWRRRFSTQSASKTWREPTVVRSYRCSGARCKRAVRSSSHRSIRFRAAGPFRCGPWSAGDTATFSTPGPTARLPIGPRRAVA